MSKVLLSIALAAGLGVTATAASAQTTTSATLDAVKAKFGITLAQEPELLPDSTATTTTTVPA